MLTTSAGNRLRARRWLLLAMLGTLHGVMLVGVSSTWAQPLLLAHLGLFLLWQPLWRGESDVGRSGFVFITLAAAVVIFWLNWWAIAFWLTGLFGLVGARVFAFRDRWIRLLYLLVMAYLLGTLLFWVVPNLFGAQAAIEVGRVMMWYVLLPGLLLAMPALSWPVRVAVRAGNEPGERAQTVDFIYSLLLFMLLTLVVLGSLAFMTLARLDYLEALLRTLLLTGLVLLALGGLWSPRFGFTGLQGAFSRYLLNIGSPFESWLTQLAEAAQTEPDPASYLRRATGLLADFSWLSGLTWQSPHGVGELGQSSKHEVQVQEGELYLTLYARHSPGPAVLLHIGLLTQLIGYFYQAKQHEQSLRNMTRLQAVYETGSRLTHDLKNMLQSLLSLASLAQSPERRAQELLQQQLPLLVQRIELTLDKLCEPQECHETPQLALGAWWDGLRLRNRHREITWRAPEILPDRGIPVALFDCVLDNLLDNALVKRQAQPGIGIVVELRAEPLRITVCDSGVPIPESIAANLMSSMINSENGYGLGLYQVSRWAWQLDYRLALASNKPGKVCFELSARPFDSQKVVDRNMRKENSFS